VTSDGPPFEAFSKVLPLNPHVKFFDSRQRGYVSVEVDEHQMLTQLRVITDPRDPAATVSTLKSFVVASGRAGAMVV
jgi:alkaline phosphatase D